MPTVSPRLPSLHHFLSNRGGFQELLAEKRNVGGICRCTDGMNAFSPNIVEKATQTIPQNLGNPKLHHCWTVFEWEWMRKTSCKWFFACPSVHPVDALPLLARPAAFVRGLIVMLSRQRVKALRQYNSFKEPTCLRQLKLWKGNLIF